MNQIPDPPICPLSGEVMSFWMEVPIDPMTGYSNLYSTIFYSEKSGYGMLFPRPDAEEINSFYDLPDYYTHQQSKTSDVQPPSAISPRIPFLDRLRMRIAYQVNPIESTLFTCLHQLPHNEFRRVLDVGCGAGELLKELHSAGYGVMGIEKDPQANCFQLGLPVYEGTVEVIPAEIRCQKFDAILMSHVLEHCLDPIQALKNIYQLLRPGGYFICEVPNNDCLGLKFSGMSWLMLDVPRHLNFFTPPSLVSILEKIGFQTENLAFRGYYRQFTNSWIDYEAGVYDRLVASGKRATPWPQKNSSLRAWQLLLATILAPPQRKYDSVQVIAKRP